MLIHVVEFAGAQQCLGVLLPRSHPARRQGGNRRGLRTVFDSGGATPALSRLTGFRRLHLLRLCRRVLEENFRLFQKLEPSLNLLLRGLPLKQKPVRALYSSDRILLARALRTQAREQRRSLPLYQIAVHEEQAL